jgi:hypothetical protein
MLKPFTAKIEAAYTDRNSEIVEQFLMPDQQYQALNTKINDSLDQIEKNLPPEKVQLIFELDSSWIERVERPGWRRHSRNPG